MKPTAVLVGLLLLAGCGGNQQPITADPTSPDSPAVTTDSSSTTPPDQLSARVTETATRTAEGVLAAAVILARGDVEQAVSDGVVTPAEVDAALDAIDSGTLDEWAALATD